MNQILMVENKKKKKNRLSGEKADIRNVARFFAIAIIIFAICLIGRSSYAIYQDARGRDTSNMPTINITRVNDTITVTANSTAQMTYLKYNWNNGEETAIPVDATTVAEEIVLPIENSTLYITIEEETGRAIKYAKEFLVEGMDISKPTIDIAEENESNVKITATDETQMAYITYKINDGEEIRIDKSESEDKTMNYVLKLSRGENKVVITATDTSGNVGTLEKTVIVSATPTVQYEQQANTLIVTIQDLDGIKDVEINLNGQVYAGKDINQKEMKAPFPLQEGTNTIRIKVTNINGLVAEDVKEINYAR